MNLTIVSIALAALVVLLLIIAIVAIGLNRRKSKTVSFEKNEEEPKELTQQEKSGNYQATGGFNFAPAKQAEKEPVPVVPVVPVEPERVFEPEPVEPVEVAEPVETGVVIDEATVEEDVQSASELDLNPVVVEPVEVAESVESDVVFDEAVVEGDVQSASELDPNPVVVEPVEVAEPEVIAEEEEVAEVAPELVETDVVLDEATVEEVSSSASGLDPNPVVVEPVEEPAVEEEVLPEPEVVEEAEEAAAAAAVTVDAVEEAVEQTPVPEVAPEPEPVPAAVEEIAPASGRLGRLRGRLSRSQNVIGQGVLGILSAGDLDEDAWEEIEDTLIMADLGTAVTTKVVESLRLKIAERGVSSEEEARAMLRETLIEAGGPHLDRSIKAMPYEGKPAVVLVVGVNGTGKTTTTGKLARVLVSMGHTVLLGAADTFRAAAADQLETWGRRVGASTVRGSEGADPASVAFDAVATGIEQQADVVLIDTAGRLHTATGLMDQLGKVKRVVEKKAVVDEVLLVLDATVGQNGLTQARVFRDVVDISGVVLTKLDGTAKGGIVFQVQEELGVPVKLVGLGEGADDLAPFDIAAFVDALLG
ncbi:signal recognition particle-docking protein FtsY [Corynebacterium testudinoris]|uniref:Signal recognition particle receptor FtsY n=1 Tax=Corynebacterium testudinoris TaxID=136857 RepID=A0A0G3HB57_9CORY|nr:signal recognition particle-docking protein FtsY [Corynebacterium testudinoris]AKK09143.1 signal recognition particle-docking protein FtsY [Corynebacterium testudinoris]